MKTTKDTVIEVPANQEKNVNLAQDPAAMRDFDAMTKEDLAEDQSGSDVETVLGSVHISRPSIQHAFFLLKPLLEPVLKQIKGADTNLHDLVNLLKMERVFLDIPVAISQNVPYVVDYKSRKFLYLLCRQALTLSVNGALVTTTPGQWIPINYQIGSQIFANGVNDGSPVTVLIRACDVPHPDAVSTENIQVNGISPHINAAGDLYTLGDFTEQSGLSAGSLNADLVPATDVSQYSWLSLHITNLATGGNITFQGSNDNFATQVESVNLSRVSSSSTNLNVASSTGIFEGPINFRYFRARQTAWTSGATTGVLELYNTPRALNTLPVSQGGTWTVNGTSDVTVFASAAQTTTQIQGDQTNSTARGIKVVLNVTVAGTGSITLEIDGKDAASGAYYPILTGVAVTANGTVVYTIYPGLTAVANSVVSDVLPHTWRIKVTANNANSITYSVGASLLV